MTLHVTRLALIELALSAGILGLAAPMAADAYHKVALDDRLVPATERRVAQDDAARLLHEAAWTDSERKDLAFALLSGADSPSLSEGDQAALVGRAVEEFRAYVSHVPGDGAAWAGLASAEQAHGEPWLAVAALKASILAAPWSASLVAWRCGLGIDLFRGLDDEGRELTKGQFRLQVRRSVSSLVQTAIARGGVRTVRILLANSPDELGQFEAELAKRR